jgi:hypothetical protein
MENVNRQFYQSGDCTGKKPLLANTVSSRCYCRKEIEKDSTITHLKHVDQGSEQGVGSEKAEHTR